ncbi:enoyl-CoA hydratase-related protein [Variovorax sp. efr-133-TYG-130]|uniref:enoyl-CoA hydratase-related protein n=1 Tax=Variovorax sp. efr-133-TYG-130 TaxID=3040327 RepID=UPI002554CECE|nr:enoyl-CoA hydratase-related protein [Variovorax sp. efr-133-TYG-130]
MEMVGEARVKASRESVWDALNDPAILQASIPGCEALERTADNAFTATVVSKVGPIKARFTGKVTLSDIQPPRSYTLTGEGSGGAAGFAKADIGVALEALEPQLTLLRYTVKANVGGKLAQLGSRMIDSAARKSADDFFELFGKQVEGRNVEGASAGGNAGQEAAKLLAAAIASSAPAAVAQETVPSRAGQAVEASLPSASADVAVVGVGTADEVMDVLTSEQVKIWISDGIAVVTLNRPANRNAMTYAMWRAFPAIMGAMERNQQVRAIILTGAGTDFCSGADIPEFERVRCDAAQSTAYEVAVDACCDAIANVSKPTIAVLRGYCLGGGAHLAMSCDFRYAATDAVFGIPAAKLSIIYGVRGTRKLLSLVGLPMAKKILYGAQRFPADEALRIGFVDHVAVKAASSGGWWSRLRGSAPTIEPGDPMVDAREFAKSMAGNAPLSIAGAKSLLNGMAMGAGALNLQRAEKLIEAASASEDYREGRKAFAEKRAPQFQGQ